MKLMTQYDYEVSQPTSGGTYVQLRELATQKIKTFYLAYPITIAGISRHMDSLTDSLCSSWFMVPLSKEEKKQKQAEERAKKQL